MRKTAHRGYPVCAVSAHRHRFGLGGEHRDQGINSVLPIVQATLEAYMKANPGTNISLSGGGSGEGIKALIDSTTDIATSSREIKEGEIELAKSKGSIPPSPLWPSTLSSPSLIRKTRSRI